MKKYISILLLLCLSLFTACEETVTMDGSVGARVDAVMKGYVKTLAEAPNGWIAEVPTSEGIYRFHMTFTEDNMVTMYTDNLYHPSLNGVPKRSTYNIRSLQRPTLSFDTYSYLAIINDPNNGISGGSGNMGLVTDFEFEVDHLSDDGVFYLTGRINRVAATLRPATAAEETAVKEGGMMNVLINAINYKAGEYCYFLLGDKQISVGLNSRSVNISYVNADNDVVQNEAYTRTQLDGNIELLEPFSFEGEVLSGFSWDPEADTFSAVLAGGSPVVGSQAEPIIPLHNMLGPGKNYTVLASLSAMYASIDPTVNYFGYLYDQANNAMLENLGMELNEVDLEFYLTEGGSPRMKMMLLVGRYQGWVTYYLEFNEDESQFTVTDATFEDDTHNNGALFYEKGASVLANFWIGKTFKIEWSSVVFGSYSMGQIVLVGGDAPAEFIGALF